MPVRSSNCLSRLKNGPEVSTQRDLDTVPKFRVLVVTANPCCSTAQSDVHRFSLNTPKKARCRKCNDFSGIRLFFRELGRCCFLKCRLDSLKAFAFGLSRNSKIPQIITPDSLRILLTASLLVRSAVRFYVMHVL